MTELEALKSAPRQTSKDLEKELEAQEQTINELSSENSQLREEKESLDQ